jgi:hypothetical protein
MNVKDDDQESNLSDIAAEEETFVRDQLTLELGRVPTKEEVDEWLREHTESY